MMKAITYRSFVIFIFNLYVNAKGFLAARRQSEGSQVQSGQCGDCLAVAVLLPGATLRCPLP
jgi:hypothetical protein